MGGGCHKECHDIKTPNCCENNDGVHGWSCQYRRILWVVLILNVGMFVIEIAAGSVAESQALLADALDFFGDGANYAISLYVLNKTIDIRAKAALVKGVSMMLLSMVVAAGIVYNVLHADVPDHETMGVIGGVALVVNVVCAVILYRYRGGDSNRESVWICSRNDAIGNIAVVIAAAMVYVTSSKWPDLFVAALMTALALQGGWKIIKHAREELKD